MALSSDRKSDPELPPGQKWVELDIDGKPVQPQKNNTGRKVDITEEPL